MASDAHLLPPSSTKLERSLVGALVPEISGIPTDIHRLWDPATCPIDLLPWLAWALSIDRWNPDWRDEEKRQAVALAIEVQRRKGTAMAVELVLASLDTLLTLTEWFEDPDRLDPYTFEVQLRLLDDGGIAGGRRVSADFARQIVTEVTRAKPARAHLALVQSLDLAGIVGLVAAAQATNYRRLDLETLSTAAIDWSDMLQTEDGEPLVDDAGEMIDGSAA